MPSAPEAYVEWINQHVGFNPRGQAHSDFLTARIVDDLRSRCPAIGRELDAGYLELRTNVGLSGRRNVLSPTQQSADDDDDEIDPNIDGVLFRSGDSSAASRPMVPLTVENKTIMTAHGKARTNRYNDARAYASHVHAASPSTIAAFTMVVNATHNYVNPDAFARSAKSSGVNKPSDAAKTIELFRSMRLRSRGEDQHGRCEAVYILVIDYDGTNPRARLVLKPPAPDPESAFGYNGFLARLCLLYDERFTRSRG